MSYINILIFYVHCWFSVRHQLIAAFTKHIIRLASYGTVKQTPVPSLGEVKGHRYSGWIQSLLAFMTFSALVTIYSLYILHQHTPTCTFLREKQLMVGDAHRSNDLQKEAHTMISLCSMREIKYARPRKNWGQTHLLKVCGPNICFHAKFEWYQ